MAEGTYQSSQGGVARVPGSDDGTLCPTGNGETRDGNNIQFQSPVRDGLRQMNAAAGRARSWPATGEPEDDLEGYANESRTMP